MKEGRNKEWEGGRRKGNKRKRIENGKGKEGREGKRRDSELN